MAIYLVPVPNEGSRIAVDKAVAFIGRHPGCDAVLSSSRKVSRKHCCIAQVNDHLVVRDLGSMNGVRVNGQRIQNEATIRIGDELSIGDMRYRIQDGSTPPKAGSRRPDTEDRDAEEGSTSGRTHRKKRQRIDPSCEFPVAISEGSDEHSDPEIFDFPEPT